MGVPVDVILLYALKIISFKRQVFILVTTNFFSQQEVLGWDQSMSSEAPEHLYSTEASLGYISLLQETPSLLTVSIGRLEASAIKVLNRSFGYEKERGKRELREIGAGLVFLIHPEKYITLQANKASGAIKKNKRNRKDQIVP